MIGPSTGWLYAKEIYSLFQQERILKEARANSVEICLSGWDSNDRRILSLKGNEKFSARSFSYCSLHLPDFDGASESANQIRLVQWFIVRHRVTTALIHPLKVSGDYPTEYYEQMISGGVPLAIENMDSRKDSGFRIKELEGLVKNVGLLFVLDVQHAYEHDPGMQYASDLFESLKNKLIHLHVSGETADNIHSLICKATNAKKILEFISGILSSKNVPLILEGEYETADDLKAEIQFLRRELCL